MIQGSIARRYARALIEVAGPQFEQVGEELAGVAGALQQTPELAAVFTNPAVAAETRSKLLAQLITATKLSDTTANLLRLLDDRRRIPDLPAIDRAYRTLADEQAGRLRAKITSASALPADFAKRLETQLTAATRKNVAVESALDPSLLGGVVAQVGNTVYDGSLKNQLEALRRELKQNL